MAIQPLPVDAEDGVTVVDEEYLNTNWGKVNENFAEVAGGGATAEQAQWTAPASATAAEINALILARWNSGGGKVWLSGTQYNVTEPVRVRPMSTHSDTAQSGSTSTTIKLATTAATNNFDYLQALVKITTGTGAGQTRTISAYNNSTKVATVTTAWGTTPDNTSVYTVQYWSSAQWMVDLVGNSVHGTKIVAASGFADGTFDGKKIVVRLEGGLSDRSGLVSEMTIDANGHADYSLYVAATVERTLEKLNLQGAVISPLVIDAAQNLKFAEVRCMGGQYSKLIMNGAASLNFDRCEFTNATIDTVWSGADSSFRAYNWYTGVVYPLMNKYDTCLFEIPPVGGSAMVPLRVLAGVGLLFDNCTFATSYTTGTKSAGCVVLGDGSGSQPVEDIHFNDCQFYRGGDTSSGDYIVVNDEVLGTVVEDGRFTGGYSGGNVAIRSTTAPVTVRGWTFRDTPKTFVGNIHAQPGRTSWTTSARPTSSGVIPPGLNTTTGRFEFYDGTAWQNLVTDDDLTGLGAGATPWFVPVPDTDPQQYQATGPDGPIGDPIELEVVQSNFVKSPKSYGAEGDGTTDDTAAVQDAIDALPAGGGELYFTDGTYALGGSVTVTKPLRVRCDPAVVLKMTAAVPALLISDTTDVSIEGVTFDGDRDTVGAGIYNIIEMEDVSRVGIRGCKILDTQSGGVKITRGTAVWINDNYFSNIYHSGVYLADPGTGDFNEDIWVCNNRFDHITVDDLGGHSAVQAFGTGEESNRNIHVLNNIITDAICVGIGLDSVDKSQVSGNVIYRSAEGSTGGECIAFTGSEVVIAENYCHNTGATSAAGILCWAIADRSCDENQIINNRCTNSGQGVGFSWGQNGAAVKNLLIEGNTCYRNAMGIQSFTAGFTGSQTNVVIRGNHLVDNGLGTGDYPSTGYTYSLIANASGITGAPAVETFPTPTIVDPILNGSIHASNGTAVLDIFGNASAIARVGLFNATTGNGPGFYVESTDTDADFNISSKNAGKVKANGVPVATIRETVVAVTGTSKTLALTDAGCTLHCTNGSATTITVPTNASAAFAVGDTVAIRQYGAGQVTVAAAGGVTINPSSTLKIAARYKTAVLTKIDTNEWHLDGSLTA